MIIAHALAFDPVSGIEAAGTVPVGY